jgi:hypothetical protein
VIDAARAWYVEEGTDDERENRLMGAVAALNASKDPRVEICVEFFTNKQPGNYSPQELAEYRAGATELLRLLDEVKSKRESEDCPGCTEGHTYLKNCERYEP